MSVADTTDLAALRGFCSQVCHTAHQSRAYGLDVTAYGLRCQGCGSRNTSDTDGLIPPDSPLRTLFCTDECMEGHEVRLGLARKHILTARLLPGSYGGGRILANGLLRGVTEMARMIKVPQILVYQLLGRGVSFERVTTLVGDRPERLHLARVNAGKGGIFTPVWSDTELLTGPGDHRVMM
jgi:hypothetical protein